VTKVDYPDEIRALIVQLKRLPGIGPRSAERIALWLLRSAQNPAAALAAALTEAAERIVLCDVCGFFASRTAGCRLCGDTSRDTSLLCVVEQSTDILPLERTGAYHGHYHVLGGRISPLDNVGPEELRIGRLVQRLEAGGVREVILATGSDVEGEATANYLTTLLRGAHPDIHISRLAQGLPAGGGLDSADELTLFRALSGRRTIQDPP
jgi:recombination protein RecR